MWCHYISGTVFQFTLPRRERLAEPVLVLLARNFNSRSREGSDHIVRLYLPSAKISIHAPAKGATGEKWHLYARKPISIHAPAKGATEDEKALMRLYVISIHAPAKGATRPFLLAIVLALYFNSRSREGSDLFGNAVSRIAIFISIHAPAKGATRMVTTIRISIHAPAKGATSQM